MFYFQHQEYEAIYRSFKISQQRHAIRREIICGRLPVTALDEFDAKMSTEHTGALLATYYK